MSDPKLRLEPRRASSEIERSPWRHASALEKPMIHTFPSTAWAHRKTNLALRLAITLLSVVSAPSAGAHQDPEGTKKGTDVVSVARKEAERESATLNARVKELLRYLMLKTDIADPAIDSRIEELVHIGSVAVPLLLGAMDYPENSPPESATPLRNAGINAARAIARIPGPAVSAAIVKMSREGSVNGKRNAAIALGLRGDSSLFPALSDLVTLSSKSGLSQAEKDIVAQALIGVGVLGGAEAATLLERFISAGEGDHAAAAISGLSRIEKPSDAILNAVVARLNTEIATTPPNEHVLASSFGFFATHPRSEVVDAAAKAISDPLRSAESRVQASHALRSIARKYESSKRKALSAMSESLQTASGAVLEEIALDMRELGDDAGIDAVVDPLSKQIREDPKNFALLYARGEAFFRLREFKLAKRDIVDALKKEKDPRQPERVYITIARCSISVDDAREAARWLKEFEDKSGDQDFSVLPRLYPEFTSMAKDPQYEKLFAPKAP